jgi:hypothetical protein
VTPAACPSWCHGHVPGDVTVHLSVHPPVPLGDGDAGGIATAYAAQAEDDPTGPAVEVVVLMPGGRQEARLRVTNPSAALNLAYLLRLLANATPRQHSELAGLISAAAAITMSHDAAPG